MENTHENNITSSTRMDLSSSRASCSGAVSQRFDKKGTIGTNVIRGLSWLDRLLALWIILAIALGILLGYFVPGMGDAFNHLQLNGISIPIAIGLLWMMYPILCKVQFELLPQILISRSIWKQLAISITLNWIIAPAIMTALAWATLPDLPGYRNGVILVGLARCIAMVLIWNQIAGGDSEYCAILVAINSLLQIALYSPFAYFYLNVVPSWFGATPDKLVGFISVWDVARSVLIFLGIPLAAAVITRFVLLSIAGRRWYNTCFLPYFGPTALLGLLFTIVIMFGMQGRQVIENIVPVVRVAVPLLAYFIIIFFLTLSFLRMCLGAEYEVAVTQTFTAASNNFELAIAVAVATFGIDSEEALASVVGPLIEVPVLIGLVYLVLWLSKRWGWRKEIQADEDKYKPREEKGEVDPELG
ncbi:uncharacterized protein VTP21DRAFT_8567 [Calcarisporiella thermophila]|uniref:uncharacterized protein n=1 Tax=Calcarisporiella thermophila TaxID=911321 RepID=UPI0037427267